MFKIIYTLCTTVITTYTNGLMIKPKAFCEPLVFSSLLDLYDYLFCKCELFINFCHCTLEINKSFRNCCSMNSCLRIFSSLMYNADANWDNY